MHNHGAGKQERAPWLAQNEKKVNFWIALTSFIHFLVMGNALPHLFLPRMQAIP